MTKTQIIQEAASHAQIGNIGGGVAKYVGLGTSAAGLFSLDSIALVFGMICAAVGVFIQWHFKNKEYKLKEKQYAMNGVKLDE